MNGLLICILIAAFLQRAHANVFSTPMESKKLLANEAGPAVAVINAYISTETKRLPPLKELPDEYALRNRKTKAEMYMNPANVSLLIQRLASDSKNIEEIMNANVSKNFVKNITHSRAATYVKYPEEKDTKDATLDLLHMQKIYKLATADLADGIIWGERISEKLTSRDCYEVAMAAYKNENNCGALIWTEEALNRMKTENPPTIRNGELLEFLALILYRQGNPKQAFATVMRIADEDPTHDNEVVDRFRDLLAEEDKEENTGDLLSLCDEYGELGYFDKYGQLCRGEYTIYESTRSQLYCYFKRDRDYLKLAPIKVEIIHLQPIVVLFRNIISDSEIEVIKRLATPKLTKSGTLNVTTGETTFIGYRKSENAWLKDESHEIVHRLSSRLDLMTNLEQSTAEELQVASYGIGGFYYPHYDMSDIFKQLKDGDRIATVLFYMSQPKMGGATVYTELDTGVQPSIHDALFWYNLKRSGEGDLRTLHAACPVLSGVKWVSNKWIHERGQEFRRPCGLSPDVEERFVGDLSPQ